MHGLSKTRLYRILSGMKSRCYNENDKHFKWYGGKGVIICDEWIGENGVQSFIEWALNHGYEEHLTIDRIDANGPYSPENCRWITLSENVERVERSTPHEIIETPGLNYKIDIIEALKDVGFNSTRILKENILSQSAMQKLRKGEMVGIKTLEHLCKLLDMQPGDIIKYVGEE